MEKVLQPLSQSLVFSKVLRARGEGRRGGRRGGEGRRGGRRGGEGRRGGRRGGEGRVGGSRGGRGKGGREEELSDCTAYGGVHEGVCIFKTS